MDSIDGGRPPSSGGGAPALAHHHSMSGSIPGQAPPTPHSIAPHSNAGRPGIDRAHTFPTPPTSASSVMGMGSSGSSYEWNPNQMANGVNGTQPLSIDTINARSMPTTPATTPPGQSQQNMQGYPGQQGYDNKASYNTTPGSAPGYPPHADNRYGHAPFTKSEMGPPSAPAGAASVDAHDGHGQDHHDGHHAENGYPSAYAPTRSYTYNPTTDHAHLSPEMTGSPHGRGTPRSMAPNQPGWGAHEYHTPPRVQNSSNVYNVMANTGGSNGPSSDGPYPSSAYSGGGMPSAKRGRDDDEDRPDSRDYDYKRQKTGPARQESFGMPLQPPHMQAIKTGGQR